MESLSRAGIAVEALSGTALEREHSEDPAVWLAARGLEFETIGGGTLAADARGKRAEVPTHFRLIHGGVPVTLHRSPASGTHEVGELEQEEFLRLYSDIVGRFQPEVVVNYGGDDLAHEVRSRSRRQGMAVVFPLHNFSYRESSPFETADAVIVPSRFAAAHYRNALGLDCTVLPNLIDLDRVRARSHDRHYLTFVNPSYEKGVYAFARIADELGNRRPDIPLLVVEARGSERTLADCGLDLRVHGNVSLMGHTPDPRQFWGVTRLCLLPSLWWENQPLAAVEAMMNGIPVIGSDRGGIPECLGGSGIVLPLPERLTPFTRELPTADEVGPWIEAIVRLWDDTPWYAEHGRRALAEARRWEPDALQPRYARFFNEVRPATRTPVDAGQRGATHTITSPISRGDPMEAARQSRPSIEAGIRVIRRRWPGIINECDDDPVFVLAAGWRSGSTMLQRMIVRSCFLWGEPFGHAGLIDALADPIRCFTERWPESHHFHRGEDPDILSERFIANLYPPTSDLLHAHQSYFNRLFAEPARRNGAERWGLKEVRLDCNHAFYLKWLFPRARFLFLIRNPYDAWRSYAARAARGWKWYHRWPDEPVTVGSFAAHWRRLATSFLENHHRVNGRIVRYEDLSRSEHSEAEEYLGFPLSVEAARLNPADGGPEPLAELLAADRIVLEKELGPLASSLGYEAGIDRPRATSSAMALGTVPVETATEDQPGARTEGASEIGVHIGSTQVDRGLEDPGRCAILVPVGHHIEPRCDEALRGLERRGYAVRRVGGYSAIDQARNQIATDALRDGFEELFWVDSDIVFSPGAVDRLRSHGLPIVGGIYPKKGIKQRSFACKFSSRTDRVDFGEAGGLIEVSYAGTGFLLTRREVYQAIQEHLTLPVCNERFGPSMIPFFQPTVVPDGRGHWYLAEDYSFCHRARECGYRIMADTTIRLEHIGPYAFCWEDAGSERPRHGSYTFRIVE